MVCRSPAATTRRATGSRSAGNDSFDNGNDPGRASLDRDRSSDARHASVALVESDYVSRMAAHKEAALRGWLREQGGGRIAIGYSGGVDSAYLAAVAVGVLGVTAFSPSPGEARRIPKARIAARETARDRLEVLEIDTAGWKIRATRPIRPIAATSASRSSGPTWCRGACARHRRRGRRTNADDLSDHRPGARAARNSGSFHRSPRSAHKSEIRTLSRRADDVRTAIVALSFVAHPVRHARYSGRLKRVERAEASLRELGIAATFGFDISGAGPSRAHGGRAVPLEHWRAKRVDRAGVDRNRVPARGDRSSRISLRRAHRTGADRPNKRLGHGECACFWRLICRSTSVATSSRRRGRCASVPRSSGGWTKRECTLRSNSSTISRPKPPMRCAPRRPDRGPPPRADHAPRRHRGVSELSAVAGRMDGGGTGPLGWNCCTTTSRSRAKRSASTSMAPFHPHLTWHA